ncbi:MAG: hypothetical protein LBB58_03650 [Cellulomonadaceae bacterium]|jgi:hypothetical protein|nr:hypothetical protein [Cellulomonadaceae bacterium]
MADKYDLMAEACERGDYPGEPGPIFHGQMPEWYGRKVLDGSATDADTAAAQLEVADARIRKLESTLAEVRQLVKV